MHFHSDQSSSKSTLSICLSSAFIEPFPESFLHLFFVPPGGFYAIARKTNEVEIEKESSYGYSLTYGIFEKYNKNNVTCKESLNFLDDKCKLNQVLGEK